MEQQGQREHKDSYVFGAQVRLVGRVHWRIVRLPGCNAPLRDARAAGAALGPDLPGPISVPTSPVRRKPPPHPALAKRKASHRGRLHLVPKDKSKDETFARGRSPSSRRSCSPTHSTLRRTTSCSTARRRTRCSARVRSGRPSACAPRSTGRHVLIRCTSLRCHEASHLSDKGRVFVLVYS